MTLAKSIYLLTLSFSLLTILYCWGITISIICQFLSPGVHNPCIPKDFNPCLSYCVWLWDMFMPVFCEFYLKFPTQLQVNMGDYWVVSYSIATCLHPLAICMDDSSTDWIIHIGVQPTTSMFAFIYFIISAWFWAAVIIASVLFFIYPDLNHCQVTLLAKSAIDWGNFPFMLFLPVGFIPFFRPSIIVFLSLLLYHNILLTYLCQHRFFWFFQIIPIHIAHNPTVHYIHLAHNLCLILILFLLHIFSSTTLQH